MTRVSKDPAEKFDATSLKQQESYRSLLALKRSYQRVGLVMCTNRESACKSCLQLKLMLLLKAHCLHYV